MVMKNLWLDGRLVYQHYRNVITDGIDAVAFDTLQPASIFFKYYLGFANGADENFEQLFAYGHEKS
jgi:hypothetical protein